MMRVSLSVTWWVSLIMWMVQKGSGPGAGLAGLLDLWACWPGLNLSKCFLRKVTHCMFTEQFQACVWATKMYLFFKQKPSCLALLVPVNLCGVQSKDRFPKMHCGERSPWEKRNWSLRAGLWILLDSWFSEVKHPIYLTDPHLIHSNSIGLQQAGLLRVLSAFMSCQITGQWWTCPWQVGAMAEMAFLGSSLNECGCMEGGWHLEVKGIDNEGKWKMQPGSFGHSIFNGTSFLLFLLLFPVLSFLLYCFFPLPSPPLFPTPIPPSLPSWL